MVVGLGRIRHALGDGVTEQQARQVLAMLTAAGLLDEPLKGGRIELCGVAEIAKMAGVSPAAVCQWVGMPEPIARLKGGRIWDRREIRRFLAGRKARKR